MIPARREEARRRQLMAVNEVTRDWRVTWKINAVTDAWVMETRWRPPTKAEVREIVRRYREAQAKVPPFDVIEFERHLQPGAAGKFFGDDGEGAARPAAAA